MEFDWRIRLGLVIGGVVIVAVALAGAAWGALDSGLVQQAMTLIGGLLAGLGVAAGKGRSAAVLLLIALPWLPACSGSQASDVNVTQCAATVMRCALEVARDCVPHDGESCPIETDE